MPHMSHRPELAAVVLGLVALTACSSGSTTPPPQPAEPASAATALAPGITTQQVSGATITGVFEAPLTLVDGAYEGPPIELGLAIRPMAVLMTPLVRIGQLDDQPGDDAAAVLGSNEGGSGERISLAVVSLRDGKAVSVATTEVGDRTKLRDVRLSGRDIVLDVIEIGPDEAACCGTQLATKTYRLDGSTLSMVSSEVTGKKSLETTVAGATWTAVALDGTPLPAGVTPPSLTFENGRISGSSGCNQYTGTLREPEPGRIVVGPTAGTRRACVGEAEDVESRFLAILATCTNYTFLSGRLVLSGLDGEQMRNIAFSR